jgi:hypothetical protein
MARQKPPKFIASDFDEESTLLDVVDSILNRGAVVNGDLILGVANVDLIYANLSVVLAAVDRAMQPVNRVRRTDQHPGRRGRRRPVKKK